VQYPTRISLARFNCKSRGRAFSTGFFSWSPRFFCGSGVARICCPATSKSIPCCFRGFVTCSTLADNADDEEETEDGRAFTTLLFSDWSCNRCLEGASNGSTLAGDEEETETAPALQPHQDSRLENQHNNQNGQQVP
jgi:hypothetical protein